MKLMKKSNFPSLLNERWLTDFFDTDRYFFDSDLLKTSVPMLPPVNISEEEKEFVVEVAIPGMEKKDFVIAVENGVLNISAEHKVEKEEKEKDFTRREFNYQSFVRSFTLPENVSDEKIVANYENGILKLQLGKKILTKVPPRKEIAVH
jgi:HSP20 family protein